MSKELREAAEALLLAIDQTYFYDLGVENTEGKRELAEEGFEDRDMLDGSGPNDYGLRAGPVRRLREALKATVDATCDLK